ncbi:hypothetical protein [Streptomyces avermitilis]|uniref:hypothetical protein n=1 Tax=Streptomyces avermitilis TaxID=33903 RepID=UPI0038153FD8
MQIAPSKTDEERALLVSPELADVLSTIVTRVRDRSRAIPLSSANIRKALNEALAAIGMIDENSEPLRFQPHDFLVQVSLAGAQEKLAQLDARQECGASKVFLGVPLFDHIGARTGGEP